MKIEKKRVISFLLSFSIMINFFMSLTTIDAHATGTGYVSFKDVACSRPPWRPREFDSLTMVVCKV
ncbi:hypothetical protein [Clostridium saccharobutylicum]|uniref:hypothetical protein n=1 Tax=Clostridium saccharobutylicum TaxID=169679 RepID=UPI0018C88DA9|nr:hypothetical protein [Clostridium saccharobutylicum]